MARTWTQPGSPGSPPRRSGGAPRQVGARLAAGGGRLAWTWRRLSSERRLAAAAACGLILSLFLPWYQSTVIVSGPAGGLRSLGTSATGWGAFSFVEGAVLLVAVGVLALLYLRAQARPFHLPGGDGTVIMAAGLWTCVLVLWRVFDKEGGTVGHGHLLTSTGVEFGIFVALAIAALLAYAGTQIRALREPEPPLPGEPGSGRPAPRPSSPAPRGSGAARQAAPRRDALPRAHAAPPALAPSDPRPPVAPRSDRTPVAPGSDPGPGAHRAPVGRDRRDPFGGLETVELQDPPTIKLDRAPRPPAPE